SEFGLSPTAGWLRQLGAGLLLSAVPGVLLTAVEIAAGHLQVEGWAHRGWWMNFALAAAYALYTLGIGFAEEVPHRGYLLPNLIAVAGRRWGIVLSTLLFTLPHLVGDRGTELLNVASVFLAGVMLALLRLGT